MWQKTLIFANKRKYLRINAILFNSFLNHLSENEKKKLYEELKGFHIWELEHIELKGDSTNFDLMLKLWQIYQMIAQRLYFRYIANDALSIILDKLGDIIKRSVFLENKHGDPSFLLSHIDYYNKLQSGTMLY